MELYKWNLHIYLTTSVMKVFCVESVNKEKWGIYVKIVNVG